MVEEAEKIKLNLEVMILFMNCGRMEEANESLQKAFKTLNEIIDEE
jgi:hypothetical protein